MPEKGQTSMEVFTNDYTYSTTLNPGENHHSRTEVNWGEAHDCRGYSWASPMKLDLTGTPFKMRDDYPDLNPTGHNVNLLFSFFFFYHYFCFYPSFSMITI